MWTGRSDMTEKVLENGVQSKSIILIKWIPLYFLIPAWCSDVNTTKEEAEADSSECDIDSFYIMGDMDDFIQESVGGFDRVIE